MTRLSKKRIILAWVLVLSIVVGLITIDKPALAKRKRATLTSFSGTVEVKRKMSNQYLNAFTNMNISEGDTIRTSSDGEAKITVDGINVVDIGKSSSISITNLEESDIQKKTHYKLIYGSVFLEVNEEQADENAYKVETSNTIMGVRGTKFAVSYTLVGSMEKTDILTLEGEVYAQEIPDGEGVGEKISVKAGESISIITNRNKMEREGNKGKIDLHTLDVETLSWIVEQLEKSENTALDKNFLEAAKENLEKAEKAAENYTAKEKPVENKISLEDLLGNLDVYTGNEVEKEEVTSIFDEDDESEGEKEPVPEKTFPLYVRHTYDTASETLHIIFDEMLHPASTLLIEPAAMEVVIRVEGNALEADFSQTDKKTYRINLSLIQSMDGNFNTEGKRIIVDRKEVIIPEPEKTVFEVYTADDLDNLQVKFGNEFGGKTGVGVTIRLEADIDWSEISRTNGKWEGILLAHGVFDGNGKTISNLVLSNKSKQANETILHNDAAGFIRAAVGIDGIEMVTIKNLTLDNAKLDISGKALDGGVGILVGKGSNLVVEAVNITNSTVKQKDGNTGGLIGILDSGSGSFHDIFMDTVEVININFLTYNTGILMGGNPHGQASFSDIHITNSKADGTHNVGALAGEINQATIGKVEIVNSEMKGWSYVGGIFGASKGDLTFTDTFSMVDSDVVGYSYIGGFIGKMETSQSTIRFQPGSAGKIESTRIGGQSSSKTGFAFGAGGATIEANSVVIEIVDTKLGGSAIVSGDENKYIGDLTGITIIDAFLIQIQ